MIQTDDLERFERRVDRSGGPDACHPWSSAGKVGYGSFVLGNGVTVNAHRLAYTIAYGAIPSGLTVDHTCHNAAAERGECAGGNGCLHRRCVNPAHLEAVTQDANNRRSPNYSSNITRCPRGHPYDADNTYEGPTGGRRCRQCARERQEYKNEWRRAKKRRLAEARN